MKHKNLFEFPFLLRFISHLLIRLKRSGCHTLAGCVHVGSAGVSLSLTSLVSWNSDYSIFQAATLAVTVAIVTHTITTPSSKLKDTFDSTPRH